MPPHTVWAITGSFLSFLSTTCLWIAVFAFLFIPSTSFQKMTGEGISPNSLSVILFVTVVGWFTLTVLSRWLSPYKSAQKSLKLKTHCVSINKTLVWVFQITVSILIFSRALVETNRTPLEIDEHYATLRLLENPAASLNPFLSDANHFANTVTTYLSIKVFEVGKLSLRAPALLFTLILLVGLNFFGSKLDSWFTRMLLFLHFLVNSFVGWYLHAARGYSALIALSLISFFVLLGSPHNRSMLSLRTRWGLFLVYVLTAVNHFFGGLFSFVLFLSFLIWLLTNRESLGDSIKKVANMHLLIMAASFPLMIAMFLGIFFDLKSRSLLGVSHGYWLSDLPQTVQILFGLDNYWFSKPLLLLAIYLAYREFASGDFKQNFPFIVILAGSSLIFWLFAAVKAHHMDPRAFLAYVVPFVFWLGESSSGIRTPSHRFAVQGLLIMTLVVGPLWGTPSINSFLANKFVAFDLFVTEVQKRTSPIAKNCYSFSGKREISSFCREIYFRARANIPNCDNRYHLHFETGPDFDTEWTEEKRPPKETLETVFTNGEGMILYRMLEAKKKESHP